jgi:membrane-associated phospholipid phosphatase
MKQFARLISGVFHPLLFPTYGTLLILYTNPNLYGYPFEKIHTVWLIIIFALTFMFPVIWLFMMRRLEMIDSFNLETAKERIIPFIATATFYLWTAWMFKPSANMKIPPNQLVFYMMLGACVAIFLGFFINIFSKISLHAMAAGNLLGLLLSIIRFSTYDLRMVFIGALLLAGLIGTARLILNAHSPREIFTGYLAGFFGQFIAFSVLPIFL